MVQVYPDSVSFINLPGIGGSGDSHWQTLWEATDTRFSLFTPESWDRPEVASWCNALDVAISARRAPIVLIAHSLACLLVAHWAARGGTGVAGALLVSVPDPESPSFPAQARSFGNPPDMPLPFPTLVLASEDDPYSGPETTRRRAAAWRSTVVGVGPRGHINANSGLGDWRQGRQLLDAFVAGLQQAS